ncbi:hypothetical protein B6U98_00380 [Thermoplasmatales archaeon ex4572_165]|nr:MAG: hypothetical protein B6U98_00380 [Thermoplasmatales archaeon ex4572_165]RLF59095.1 MAG: hypothetical protein DRN27_03630 [Thermoplasmata archaeon]
MENSNAVIGIGNPYRSDDGIGIYLVNKIRKKEHKEFSKVDFIDGGTGGMNLFHLISMYEAVILVDAVFFEGKPGEYLFFSTNEIHSSNKITSTVSTHGSDIFTVIKSIKDIKENPPQIYVFGIQPASVSLSDKFSEEISENIPLFIQKLESEIKRILVV